MNDVINLFYYATVLSNFKFSCGIFDVANFPLIGFDICDVGLRTQNANGTQNSMIQLLREKN